MLTIRIVIAKLRQGASRSGAVQGAAANLRTVSFQNFFTVSF